jgi:hypothetical protein
MKDIFGYTFGVFFQVQMIWHKLPLKTRGKLNMPMKKIKIFHLFWNVGGKLKVWKIFFLCFQIENKVTNMHKIFFLHPNTKL